MFQPGVTAITLPTERSAKVGYRDIPAQSAERDAIGSLTMRYQPVVSLSTGLMTGVEALVRRVDSTGGLLPPGRFIDEIERAGLGALLSEIVVRTTLAEIGATDLCRAGSNIGVNMPLDVVLDPGTPDLLEDARQEAGIPASQIVIELTESQPADDLPALRRALDRLCALGYRTAIDDFTHDMPNGAALLDLPFTTLKLDISMVRSGDDAFLLRTVESALRRGLFVVAEGIDGVIGWRRLRDAGVSRGQGYWIGPPLAAPLLPAWMLAWDARRRSL